MSAILVILTALILIIVGMTRRQAHTTAPAVLARRYHHPGHTWLRTTEDGDVIVGLDDFAQNIIGDIDEVELPRLLGKVRQGTKGVSVWHGDRCVELVSPVTGRVVQKNESILANPSLANSSPYGEGWLMRIHPANLENQLGNLLKGRLAQQWEDLSRARLARMFSGTPGLLFQDGGALMRNIADLCSDDEWKTIQREIFCLNELPTKENTL